MTKLREARSKGHDDVLRTRMADDFCKKLQEQKRTADHEKMVAANTANASCRNQAKKMAADHAKTKQELGDKLKVQDREIADLHEQLKTIGASAERTKIAELQEALRVERSNFGKADKPYQEYKTAYDNVYRKNTEYEKAFGFLKEEKMELERKLREKEILLGGSRGKVRAREDRDQGPSQTIRQREEK